MKYMRVLLCLLLLVFASCDKKYSSPIPDLPVYLELDLNFEDKDLRGVQAYKIFTPKQNVNQYIEKTGFAGVLVFNSGIIDEYGNPLLQAYDIACPHEALRSVVVSVDDDRLYAVCPKCGSKYDLLSGAANPVEGPSQYTLKHYSVSVRGDGVVYVTN